MTVLEMIFAGCVIIGFVAFVAALAWASHDYKRAQTLISEAGED
jgi:hypothetical protein